MIQILVVLPIALMVIFGVPHGALDGAIIFQKFSTFRQRLVLLLGYLLLSAVCVLLWFIAPTICLAIFLALSIWHFGYSDQGRSDDAHFDLARFDLARFDPARSDLARSDPARSDLARSDPARSDLARSDPARSDKARSYQDRFGPKLLPIWRTLSDGGIWVLLVPFSHQSAVRELFVVLGADASFIMQAIDLLILPWIILALASVAERIFHGLLSSAVVALGFAALGVMSPPLWSLCLYFCAWHSRRHVISVLAELPNPTLGWISMILLTAATVLLALLAVIWLPVSTVWSAAVTQIFFIGLFALTVPHMLLIDMYLPFARRVAKRDSLNALDYRAR